MVEYPRLADDAFSRESTVAYDEEKRIAIKKRAFGKDPRKE